MSVVAILVPSDAIAQQEQETFLQTESFGQFDSDWVKSEDRPTSQNSSFLSDNLVPTVPEQNTISLEEELLQSHDIQDFGLDMAQSDLGSAQPENIRGQMRSDRFTLPEGISKEEADTAEILESRLQVSNQLEASNSSNCEVFWPSSSLVCGAILELYKEIGGRTSWLGLPTSNELTNPDGQGKRSSFMGGSIYWHPSTGAHALTLYGMRQWGTLGWEAGPLGYPISGPADINIPLTQMQRFQGGDSYYNALTGGSVWGDIKKRYDEMGGSTHPIGIPISNEQASGEEYLYSNFSNGTISWRSDRETRYMFKATQTVWEANGRETGVLGYPLSDEVADLPGIKHRVPFQDGEIFWGGILGTIALNGQAYAAWRSFEDGHTLGYPIGLTFNPLINSIETELGYIEDTLDGIRIGVENGDWIPGTEPIEDIELEQTDSLSLIEDSSQYGQEAIQEDVLESWATTNSVPAASILQTIYLKGGGTPVVIRLGAYNGSKGFGLVKATQKHNVTNQDTIAQVFMKGAEVFGSNPTAISRQFNYFRVECDLIGPIYRCEITKDIPVLAVSLRGHPKNYMQAGHATRLNSRDTAPMGLLTIFCPNEQKLEKCDNFINLPSTVAAAGG